MKTLAWKTNFGNPYDPAYSPLTNIDETYDDALERERQWFDSMIKGPPQATDRFSVEELEEMGIVGLYRLEGEDNNE